MAEAAPPVLTGDPIDAPLVDDERVEAGNVAVEREEVLVLDFGGQYSQLIARRVREAHVYCEIHPCDVDDAFVRDFAPKGVILSGSHMSAYEDSTGRAPKAVFDLGWAAALWIDPARADTRPGSCRPGR